jgi:hypothetical protein
MSSSRNEKALAALPGGLNNNVQAVAREYEAATPGSVERADGGGWRRKSLIVTWIHLTTVEPNSQTGGHDGYGVW